MSDAAGVESESVGIGDAPELHAAASVAAAVSARMAMRRFNMNEPLG